MRSILRAPQRTCHPRRTISLPSLGLSEHSVWGFFFSELTRPASAPTFASNIQHSAVHMAQTDRSCGLCSGADVRSETLSLKQKSFTAALTGWLAGAYLQKLKKHLPSHLISAFSWTTFPKLSKPGYWDIERNWQIPALCSWPHFSSLGQMLWIYWTLKMAGPQNNQRPSHGVTAQSKASP